MNRFRRMTSGVFASLDWLAAQVENHEALVEAAIQDVERSTSKAKIQFRRICREGTQLQEQINDCQRQIELWKTRAMQVIDSDRDKARECIKRKSDLEKRIAELETRLRSHRQVQTQLEEDLRSLEANLGKLNHKRALLKSREARTQLMDTLRSSDQGALRDIESIFDRWETTIGAKELCHYPDADDHQGRDPLGWEFETAEEKLRLDGELEQLSKEVKTSGQSL